MEFVRSNCAKLNLNIEKEISSSGACLLMRWCPQAKLMAMCTQISFVGM